MATTATVQVKIVKNGGPVTKDVYKAYYSDGTAASEDWAKGELLYLTAGYIKRVATNFGSAAKADTDDVPFSSANKLFVALEDHDSSAEGKSVYVSVQEITPETVFEIQCAASSTTAPLMASFTQGTKYGFYISTAGVWGLDIDESGAKGVAVVVDKDSDTKYFIADTAVAGTNGSGKFVRVKVINSLIL